MRRQCSVSCGIGERQRGYWCQVESYVVAKSYCYPVRPPVHKEACRMPDCPQWHASPWGQVLAKRIVPLSSPGTERLCSRNASDFACPSFSRRAFRPDDVSRPTAGSFPVVFRTLALLRAAS